MPEDGFKYSGRIFSNSELEYIQILIEKQPDISRAALSRQVCQDIKWFRPDGRLKDMRCRVVLLKMQEDGLLTLPPAKQGWTPPRKTPVIMPGTDPAPPVKDDLAELLPLKVEVISRKNLEASHRYNTFIHRYHYLGYQPAVGANIRYAFKDRHDRELAFMTWSSAAWQTAPRDEWIGWNQNVREERLHLIVNNSRFLILPWVSCKNLASHILGKMARLMPSDWEGLYGYRPVLAESFVDATLYTGHCYLAANWKKLGKTTGRTKWNKKVQAVANKKDIWVYPLAKNAKELLVGESP